MIRKNRAFAKVLHVLLMVSLFIPSAVPAFAADDSAVQSAAEVSGRIDTVKVGPIGDEIEVYVYVPDAIQLVAWTNPILLVYGDEDFTAETAKQAAEGSGLAALAARDNAVITFVNSKGAAWSAADVAVYKDIIVDKYAERPDNTWENGKTAGGKYAGYLYRIYVIAEGSGADFVSQYLVDDELNHALRPGFTLSIPPSSVMLFNTTHVPTAAQREYPAVVINGSEEVNAKYASLNKEHHVLFGTSSITDGFDPGMIAAHYKKLTSVRRQDFDWKGNSAIYDIPDYEALGVEINAVRHTLASNKSITYLEHIPPSVDRSKEGSVPLVMLYHGAGEKAEYFDMLSEWPALGAEAGFVTVTVDQHQTITNDENMELINSILERHPFIDRTRVYASGFSMGSMKTFQLGTQFPEFFAGIAPMNIAPAPPGGLIDVVIPTIYITGSDDPFPVFPHQNGSLNNVDRMMERIFQMNDIGNYVYDASAGNPWGITFDHVAAVKAEQGIGTITINSVKSNDGNVYTKFVNTSYVGHAIFAEHASIAWDFLSQFSRNEDGTVSRRHQVMFVTEPAESLVVVSDQNGNIVAPESDGAGFVYLLPEGVYSYTVKSDGYEVKTGSMSVTQAETIHVKLEPAIKITSVAQSNGQWDVLFDIRSANGKGYSAYISETGEKGSFVSANASFNSKGANIKKLDNSKTYFVYIEYSNGDLYERSAIVKLISAE
ncbi:hypothetical protein [Paenibacillus sp.]|uniref:alpha/beta hydrolase family esterase n=1 Tax=Paenibacillus sp. TaxID=58172 RepID=UPI002D45C1ED|nr:hypothetical protein [Paenibacillus sp.]HZG84565.1 hypothetical protein [Paenibacillus sp.]